MSRLPTRLPQHGRPSVACPSSAAPHVLVGAGDAAARDARLRQLVSTGLRVSVAQTGFEAIVKASCHVPDLIVLDDSLGDAEVAETGRLLTNCPVTAHIPVMRLASGRRVPRRVIENLRRKYEVRRTK